MQESKKVLRESTKELNASRMEGLIGIKCRGGKDRTRKGGGFR